MDTDVDPEERIEHLDEHECWRRLLSNQLGRLAFVTGGKVEILPLNYVVRERRILFRTALSSDVLDAQRRLVPFEIDGWDRTTAWSVIARGVLARVDDPSALALEERIGLAPWAPDETGPRDTLIELEVRELTGRAFHRRVDEQERWFW